MPSILITRPHAVSDRAAERISGLGFKPVVAPFFAVRHRPVVPVPHGTQAILVTSGNALAALRPGGLPLFAVGDRTAERAVEAGFADVRSAGRDAAALAELVANATDPAAGALLLASGARQGHALAADLRARGFRVVRRVCYEAAPVRRFPAVAAEIIQSGDVHAILFLSAETAAVFVRLLPSELRRAVASIVALAIGPTTAQALERLAWLHIRRARNPTLDDVLDLI
jgi:uroporphyrinogen-III synthase